MIFDSTGIRVQVMRIVKIGHDDSDGSIDISRQLDDLFKSLHNMALNFGEQEDVNIAGIDFESESNPKDFEAPVDRYWMKLVERSLNNETTISNEINNIEITQKTFENKIKTIPETTTTVIKVSHRIKVPMKEGSLFVPPHSMFAKLAPSRDRYTLLKDEL